jgi:hypothetical protein
LGFEGDLAKPVIGSGAGGFCIEEDKHLAGILTQKFARVVRFTVRPHGRFLGACPDCLVVLQWVC